MGTARVRTTVRTRVLSVWSRLAERRDSEAFSIGIVVRSQRLTPADLEPLANLLGAGWEEPRVAVLHRRARAVESEPGASLHAHLTDGRLDCVSANILRAAEILQSPLLHALVSEDAALSFDVHARQDLPDIVRRPVVMTPAAVRALAEIDDESGFDIDQYGMDGVGWLNGMLGPLIGRRPAGTPSARIEVERVGPDGTETGRAELSGYWDDRPDEASIPPELMRWIDQPVAEAQVRSTVHQRVPIVSDWGTGIAIPRALLRPLASAGSDLTIRTDRLFPLRIKPWQSRTSS